jgi:hypothetical protein
LLGCPGDVVAAQAAQQGSRPAKLLAALAVELKGHRTDLIAGPRHLRAVLEEYFGARQGRRPDAAITADQARMRRHLQPLRPGDEIIAELTILTERRKELSCDRTRAINRMRCLLTGIFPAWNASST